MSTLCSLTMLLASTQQVRAAPSPSDVADAYSTIYSPLLTSTNKVGPESCGCNEGQCQAVRVYDEAYLSKAAISITTVGDDGQSRVTELHFDRAVNPSGQMYSSDAGASAWLMRSKISGRLTGSVWALGGETYRLRYCREIEAQVLERLPPQNEFEDSTEAEVEEIEEPDELLPGGRAASGSRSARQGQVGTSRPTIHFYYTPEAERRAMREGYANMDDVFNDAVSTINQVLTLSNIDMEFTLFCTTNVGAAIQDDNSVGGYLDLFQTYLGGNAYWMQTVNDTDFQHFVTANIDGTSRGRAYKSRSGTRRLGWSQLIPLHIIPHELGHNFGLGYNHFQATSTGQEGNIMSYLRENNAAGRHFFTNKDVEVAWDGSLIKLGDATTADRYTTQTSRGNDAGWVSSVRFDCESMADESDTCVPLCGSGQHLVGGTCQACSDSTGVKTWGTECTILECDDRLYVKNAAGKISCELCPTGFFPNAETNGCVEPTCNNECRWANDGRCTDGGTGSAWKSCAMGSDCDDCQAARPEACAAAGLVHNTVTGTCEWPAVPVVCNAGTKPDGGSGCTGCTVQNIAQYQQVAGIAEPTCGVSTCQPGWKPSNDRSACDDCLIDEINEYQVVNGIADPTCGVFSCQPGYAPNAANSGCDLVVCNAGTKPDGGSGCAGCTVQNIAQYQQVAGIAEPTCGVSTCQPGWKPSNDRSACDDCLIDEINEYQLVNGIADPTCGVRSCNTPWEPNTDRSACVQTNSTGSNVEDTTDGSNVTDGVSTTEGDNQESNADNALRQEESTASGEDSTLWYIIAGAVAGCLLCTALIVAFVVIRRRKSSGSTKSQHDDPVNAVGDLCIEQPVEPCVEETKKEQDDDLLDISSADSLPPSAPATAAVEAPIPSPPPKKRIFKRKGKKGKKKKHVTSVPVVPQPLSSESDSDLGGLLHSDGPSRKTSDPQIGEKTSNSDVDDSAAGVDFEDL